MDTRAVQRLFPPGFFCRCGKMNQQIRGFLQAPCSFCERSPDDLQIAREFWKGNDLAEDYQYFSKILCSSEFTIIWPLRLRCSSPKQMLVLIPRRVQTEANFSTPLGKWAKASCNTRNCSCPAGTFPSRNSVCNTKDCSDHHVFKSLYAETPLCHNSFTSLRMIFLSKIRLSS